MRIIGKTIIALLAAYGASFALYEVRWTYKNRKLLIGTARKGQIDPGYRWRLVKK